MNRQPNTTREGGSFPLEVIEAVWNKGKIVPGYDPRVFRKDACNAWIQRTEYGRTTDYGWEIDHIVPVARGGPDTYANFQPLQWRNNRHKSDSYPNWSCALSAQ